MSAPVDDTNTEGGREFLGRRGGSCRQPGSTATEYYGNKYSGLQCRWVLAHCMRYCSNMQLN